MPPAPSASPAPSAPPPRPASTHILRAGLGCALALGLLSWLSGVSGQGLMVGSFGASCVMIFAFPDLPFSQPRNVLFGHLLSALAGLAALHSLGDGSLGLAVAGAASVALMLGFRCVHPPAGSNPVIIFLAHPGWSFLVTPVLAGVVVLLGLGYLCNNLGRRRYPLYW